MNFIDAFARKLRGPCADGVSSPYAQAQLVRTDITQTSYNSSNGSCSPVYQTTNPIGANTGTSGTVPSVVTWAYGTVPITTSCYSDSDYGDMRLSGTFSSWSSGTCVYWHNPTTLYR